MVVVEQLLLRVRIRLANLSFPIEARQSILQFLIDHHALVVLGDAPADVNLLELRPVFYRITSTCPDTIFQIAYITVTLRSIIVCESLTAKFSTF